MSQVATPAPGAGEATVEAGAKSPLSGRLVSLDAFRGMTIAGMLLVNNPGTWSAIYPPLRHAAWHGWTPTDLIFPFFLFIVGVALTFSFGKELERGADRRDLFGKMARRSLTLFGLGLVLHGFPYYDLATIRIPGVLQRIAVAFFFGGTIVLLARPRVQAAWAAVLLLGYWAVMKLVPVPGVGAGVLEPGQDLGAWIDRMIFGTEHLWSSSRTWDPEGLLSTVPAVGTVLVGSLTGEWIRSGRDRKRTLAGLLAAGAVLVVLGQLWNLVFPINKPIWTSSYVLFTGGMALLVLGACYWAIDVRGWQRWAKPFVIYGVNPIAAFFLSSLMARGMGLIKVANPAGGDPISLKGWLWQEVYQPLGAPEFASLLFALSYVILWLGIMALFYRKKIFLKV